MASKEGRRRGLRWVVIWRLQQVWYFYLFADGERLSIDGYFLHIYGSLSASALHIQLTHRGDA